MAIDCIKIKNRNGNTLIRASESFVFGTVKNSGMHLTTHADDNSASISGEPFKSVLQEAHDTWMSYWQDGRRYLSRISGTLTPDDDGQVFIGTDACMATTSFGHGMTWYNMCPTCPDACQTAMDVRRLFENIKMRLNELKDWTVLNDSTAIADRLRHMLSDRTPVPAGCLVVDDASSVSVGSAHGINTYTRGFLDSPYYVLGAYVSTIHLWNYIQTMRSVHTNIAIADEDASGVYVDTCINSYPTGGNWSVSCTMDISTTSNVLYSLLVTGVSGYLENYSSQESADVQVTHTGALHKVVGVSCRDTGANSVFHATAKFLPFLYGDLVDSDGNPVTTSNLTVQPSYQGDTVKVGTFITNVHQIIAPTEADYMHIGAYPSRATGMFLIWTIVVTWTITDNSTGTTKNITSTWLFKAAAPREPASGLAPDRHLPTVQPYPVI